MSQPALDQLPILILTPHEGVPDIANAIAQAGAFVHVASDLQAAGTLADHMEFHAVIVDAALPEATLLIERLRDARHPCLTAIVTDEEATPEAARAWVMNGAIEVIFRPLEPSRLIRATARTVSATGVLRSHLRATRRRAPHAPAAKPARPSPPSAEAVDDVDEAVDGLRSEAQLSLREATVLRYIALGYRYQDIGAELSISPRTVKMHAANVRRKAGVNNRYELLRKMFRA